MKVLQGNLHRSKTADALLDQLRLDIGADLLIISEQYRNRAEPEWYSDNLGTAAIWIPYPIPVESHGAEEGFVWVKIRSVIYVSCYFTPNEPMDDFRAKIDILEDKVREINGALVIAGDFNARALEWGMSTTNTRGWYILDMAARAELTVMNEGGVSTFRRPGYAETIPDITLVSDVIAQDITGWRVVEDYTGSDHQYITYNVRGGLRQAISSTARVTGWNVSKLCESNLLATIEAGKTTVLRKTGSPEETARVTMQLIKQACDSSMPKKRGIGRKKTAVYWWSDEIADLRKRCLRLKRLVARARRRDRHAAEQEHEEYRIARRALKYEINRSKRLKWESLKRDVDTDPWGMGYKIVMRKLGSQAPSPVMEAPQAWHIVNSLFPNHTNDDRPQCPNKPDEIPPFTIQEIQQATASLRNKKAPGPDGVPMEVLKVIARSQPEILLNVFNHCLEEGVFPKAWKNQRLVLISKKKGNPNSPSGYRPLCMLDTAGKLLERLLKPRILAAIQAAGDYSDKQYGFRKGRSTIGAVKEVIEAFDMAQHGNHYSRKIVLLATLDVKNAFNSARWADMLSALTNAFHMPDYLLRMIHSYLQDRKLIFETTEGKFNKEISGGAAQGSILGPDLWNASYDGILRMEMPDDTFMVGYADDIAAVMIARDVEDVQRKLNQVMRRTNSWLSSRGLALATEKTQLVLLTRRHMATEVLFQVENEQIRSNTVVKYLGVHLDTKLNFGEQIRHAAEKANKVSFALSRLMTNVGGPTASKRKLLMSVINSILLYGCEIWANKLKIDKYRKIMANVQRRGALRICSSYRTVSEPAIMVIAGVIPIELMAEERKKIHDTKDNLGREEAWKVAREYTMLYWQEKWQEEKRGRWTARLIKNLAEWIERKHGETNYFLTQFLTNHGYLCKYLHRMGKMEDPACIYGDAEYDDAQHTFFACEKWKLEREELERKIGKVTPDNIVNTMLMTESNWNLVAQYVELILRLKKISMDNNQQR